MLPEPFEKNSIKMQNVIKPFVAGGKNHLRPELANFNPFIGNLAFVSGSYPNRYLLHSVDDISFDPDSSILEIELGDGFVATRPNNKFSLGRALPKSVVVLKPDLICFFDEWHLSFHCVVESDTGTRVIFVPKDGYIDAHWFFAKDIAKALRLLK